MINSQFISEHWVGLWLTGLGSVVILSLVPGFSPPSQYSLDKLMHFGAHFCLAAVPLFCFVRREAAFLAVGLIPALGFALEYAQKGIAGREFSPEDMLANNLGALAGILVGLALRMNKRFQRQTGQKP